MSKKRKIAVIGCGMRATAYLRHLPEEFRENLELGAVADPSARNRSFFVERFGGRHTEEFEDWEKMLEEVEIDALIISSPNQFHAGQLIAAMALGIPILLEKPVAIRIEDCQRIWEAYQASSRPFIAVGFVLRFAPFYRRLLEITSSGELGQILQVDADEPLNAGMTSAFFRQGWRLYDRLSGGLLVEKCCHDFDILALLAGSAPKRVFSFASRTHFVPRPREEQHARFDAENTRKMGLDYGDLHIKRYFESIGDESVYSAESEVPDHQSVTIEFGNGVLSCFSVCFGQPKSTRRVRISGSNGALDGDAHASSIVLTLPHANDERWDEKTEIVSHDSSGHGGGDSQIGLMFWKVVFGGAPDANCPQLKDGIEAVLSAICAQESSRTGLPVGVDEARRRVFSDSVGLGH